MLMEAGTLNCPMCGAPTRTDAPNCGHCGARLATISCPACFATAFEGSKFCPACGTRLERKVKAGTDLPCPKCEINLEQVMIGTVPVNECTQCHGIWVQTATFDEICSDQEAQSAVLGLPHQTFKPGEQPIDMRIRYFPCPSCQALMNRVNFARCSGVIIDVCRIHGVWFEKDELHRIVQFIRNGGIERQREQQLAELQEARRRLEREKEVYGGSVIPTHYEHPTGVLAQDLVDLAGSLLGKLFR
jgi:Zn-finger nucleic acid-binding protein